MIKRDTIVNEDATGLRDIDHVEINGTVETKYIHNEIYIKNTPGSAKYIRVNYTKYERDTVSGLIAEPKKLTYKLTDEFEVQEYEIDEEGNEIEGTRTTIKEERLYLSDWDTHVGLMFQLGITKAIIEIHGLDN